MNNYNLEKAIDSNNEQLIQSLNQKLLAYQETNKNLESQMKSIMQDNEQLKIKLREQERFVQLNQNNNNNNTMSDSLRAQLKEYEENKKSIETKFKQ